MPEVTASSVVVPWLSIVITVHNRPRYIAACLRSVLSQSWVQPNVETIVVDDDSEEATRSIIGRFASACPKSCSVVTLPQHRGVGGARNVGWNAAKGRYVWFVDSDDWIAPGMVEKILTLLKHDPTVDVMLLGLRVYDQTRRTVRPHPGMSVLVEAARRIELVDEIPPGLRETLLRTPIAVCGKVVRKSLVRRWPFQPIGRAEDLRFHFEALVAARRVGIMTEPSYRYRRHGTEQITLRDDRSLLDPLSALGSVRRFLRARDCAPAIRHAERNGFVVHAMRIGRRGLRTPFGRTFRYRIRLVALMASSISWFTRYARRHGGEVLRFALRVCCVSRPQAVRRRLIHLAERFGAVSALAVRACLPLWGRRPGSAPHLVRRLKQRLDLRYLRRARLATGELLYIDPYDLVGREILDSGLYEAPMVRVFISLLREHDTVFDVGAHVGQYSLIASSLSPHGDVHAFEPDRRTYEVLLCNIARNGRGNIHPVPVALSDSQGTADFYLFPNRNVGKSSLRSRGVPGERPSTVETDTLDAYVDRTGCVPTLIKIDVEGGELQVLAGASRSLATGRPTILLEAGDNGGRFGYDIDVLASALKRKGYSLFRIGSDGLKTYRPPEAGTVCNVCAVHASRLEEIRKGGCFGGDRSAETFDPSRSRRRP